MSDEANNLQGDTPVVATPVVEAPAPVAPAAPETVTINQQSVNNEALLMQGGYDPAVATAIAASTGVGVDPEAVKQAASDYARMASQAVANGQTLEQVRFNDPRLTEEAKAEIYALVAQQQGTTAEAIAQRAEEAKQADMQAVQSALGGLLGLGAVATAPAMAMMAAPEPQQRGVEADRSFNATLGVLSTGAALEAMGGQFSPQAGLPEQQRSREQGIFSR